MSQPSDYNRTAHIYNQRYREVQFEKYRRMLAGARLSGKMLDLGCGTGLLSEFLNKQGIKLHLIGLDNSVSMLKQRGSGVLGNAESLPFKSNSFDFVLSFSVLQNLRNPEKTLQEVRRVLKPNSTFICTFVSHFSDKLLPLLRAYFELEEIRRVGEDIGILGYAKT